MRRSLTLATLLVVTAVLAACASKDNLVVVLQEPNGHIGAVVVHSESGAVLLHGANAAAGGGSGSDSMKRVDVTSDEVHQIFGSALAAQPIPPKTYILYFVSDSDTLTDDSQAAFEDVFAEIARRKAAEIAVTGHTDTVSTDEYNDKLSLQRAQTVRQLFIDRGLSPDSVIAAGRGKRELLVQTADQVREPRNRRVEITVR